MQYDLPRKVAQRGLLSFAVDRHCKRTESVRCRAAASTTVDAAREVDYVVIGSGIGGASSGL